MLYFLLKPFVWENTTIVLLIAITYSVITMLMQKYKIKQTNKQIPQHPNKQLNTWKFHLNRYWYFWETWKDLFSRRMIEYYANFCMEFLLIQILAKLTFSLRKLLSQ